MGETVGLTEGALLGEAVGLGVGNVRLYVGVSVGSAVGASVGEAVGAGVGDTSMNVSVSAPDCSALVLRVT